MHELGVSPRLQFIDVYSIHDRPVEAPIKALILNIPRCEAYDCRDMGVAKRAYNLVADAGSTEIPVDSDSVDHHYACFVKSRQRTLLELDGEAHGPICHGSEELDVWNHGMAKIKERYIRNNERLAFSILALYESEDP
ncbi:hypothetical protein MW887_009086 [Aspergillus wentii]|nr:hypothetical protein MW887_009086 [Aspergillus wentii]